VPDLPIGAVLAVLLLLVANVATVVAEFAGIEHALQSQRGGAESMLQADRTADTGAFRRGDQSFASAYRKFDRLLDKHMLTRRRDSFGDLEVSAGGRQN